MFVERSAQYTSFSSRKQPANAGTERKQFTENASVALQQPILTHAHTKCPSIYSGGHPVLSGRLAISPRVTAKYRFDCIMKIHQKQDAKMRKQYKK